jgi:hypothetical protein
VVHAVTSRPIQVRQSLDGAKAGQSRSVGVERSVWETVEALLELLKETLGVCRCRASLVAGMPRRCWRCIRRLERL